MYNDERNALNRFEKTENILQARFFSKKFKEEQWEAATRSTFKFKVLMVLLAMALLAGSIINYIYIGGSEAITTGNLPGGNDMITYVCTVGSLIAMPLLAIFFLWLGFKKK